MATRRPGRGRCGTWPRCGPLAAWAVRLAHQAHVAGSAAAARAWRHSGQGAGVPGRWHRGSSGRAQVSGPASPAGSAARRSPGPRARPAGHGAGGSSARHPPLKPGHLPRLVHPGILLGLSSGQRRGRSSPSREGVGHPGLLSNGISSSSSGALAPAPMVPSGHGGSGSSAGGPPVPRGARPGRGPRLSTAVWCRPVRGIPYIPYIPTWLARGGVGLSGCRGGAEARVPARPPAGGRG